ncbi:MAG: AraC family transcriptional regulator [Solobacterium sp.]|jgi:AraC-like DNA-binding protein/mannose-6-phosphate isomerase-like protein (cupin superfamily)|nr:AraC family transcriptional regulator [Solobacterium sp.]MCH4222658.1 AraC family transcriptional regulator [Solobacterium sp.]MCH4265146.1 AraC family transcriptional regulator [Solobacterium sp.]
MISNDVLEELEQYTAEEEGFLHGKTGIDRSIFMSETSDVIDCNHILKPDTMLSVRKHARFVDYPMHRHNYIELMYVYQGSMTHHIDGRRIKMKAGELMFLNQSISHSIERCTEQDIIFNFIIRPEFFEYLSSLMDQENELFRFLFKTLYSWDHSGEYLLFKVSGSPEVRTDIEAIIMNLYRPQSNGAFRLKLLVGLLLADLMQKPELAESYSQAGSDSLLSASILEYIVTDYREGSLQKLAGQLKQPEYKLARTIKKSTGQTFKDLVQQVRLEKAAQLLHSTDMSISDILYEVGYDNRSYFYRIFKERYHLTPSDYRNQTH